MTKTEKTGIIIPVEKRGACRQAERKPAGFDPQPDLDNANVGKYQRLIKAFALLQTFFRFCENNRLAAEKQAEGERPAPVG